MPNRCPHCNQPEHDGGIEHMPNCAVFGDDEQPYVCPGCFAVGGKCAPGCDEERMEREREDAIERGEYDYDSEDDDA